MREFLTIPIPNPTQRPRQVYPLTRLLGAAPLAQITKVGRGSNLEVNHQTKLTHERETYKP